MKPFRARVWPVPGLGLVKWCCLLVGLIAGACLADSTRRHVRVIAMVAVLPGIKPAIPYFRNHKD